MKKVIVLSIAALGFTYCNPSQQADQTTDTTKRSDATTNMTSGSARDTTQHPDTSKPQQ